MSIAPSPSLTLPHVAVLGMVAFSCYIQKCFIYPSLCSTNVLNCCSVLVIGGAEDIILTPVSRTGFCAGRGRGLQWK